MDKTYTIQNEEGDRGWIQIIDGDKEIDEVQGHTTTFNPEYKHCYIEISKEDYEIMLHCHTNYAKTYHEEYLEIIDQMTKLLLKK